MSLPKTNAERKLAMRMRQLREQALKPDVQPLMIPPDPASQLMQMQPAENDEMQGVVAQTQEHQIAGPVAGDSKITLKRQRQSRRGRNNPQPNGQNMSTSSQKPEDGSVTLSEVTKPSHLQIP